MKTGVVAFGVLLVSVALVGTVWFATSSDLKGKTAEEAPQEPVNPGPPISKTPPWPSVSLPEKEYKFGEMGVGESLSHEFVIKNTGEAPLVLEQGRTSCKCTLSNLKDNQIAPGGEAKVTLTWEPKAVEPMFRQTATILTNDPQNKSFELAVTGQVVETVTISPAGEWMLGELRDDLPEENRVVSGQLYSRLIDSLKIISLESNNPKIVPEFEPMSEDELKDKALKSGYKMKVKVEPGLPVGPIAARVIIKTEETARKEGAKPETKEYVFQVRGTRTGPLQILPGPGVTWHPEVMAVDMKEFSAAEGKKARLLLFVSGMGEEEFKLTKIDTDTPFLKVELVRDAKFTAANKQRYDLYFEVPPGTPPVTKLRKDSARVTLQTNHPDAPELKFRVEMLSE
ncbi:MAG: DUF1573 domain-containing protein [Planctomycetaceae bacterium]|nr:DUF1573 domain-containing protein [Planctomycetaceae bacterium]